MTAETPNGPTYVVSWAQRPAHQYARHVLDVNPGDKKRVRFVTGPDQLRGLQPPFNIHVMCPGSDAYGLRQWLQLEQYLNIIGAKYPEYPGYQEVWDW